MQPHDFVLMIFGALLGAGIVHFQPHNEKRKRTRAIPRGTDQEKPKRGRPPKKTEQEPGTPLGIVEPTRPSRS